MKNLVAPIDVILNLKEIIWGREVAQARWDQVVKNNWHLYQPAWRPKNGIDHERGALGELAICKGIDVPWRPVLGDVPWRPVPGAFKGADILDNIQGRCSPCKAKYPPQGFGNLNIQKGDIEENPHHYYALVVGNCPYYRIMGWILGTDGAQDKWWKTDVPEPAWFVPNRFLHKDFSPIIPKETPPYQCREE